MALPRFLLRVVDPAQVYLEHYRRDLEAGRHAASWQLALPAPGAPGSPPAAIGARRAEPAEQAARYGDRETALADAKRRWAPQLRRGAEELLTTGATELRLDQRTITARVITFWRGDHLLQTTTESPHGRGASLSRISRNPRRGGAGVLVEYLARAAIRG
ncbi:hypothetical protein [Geodermatophilus ruber]|uniref:Uncharacterized protein n=1 Tax=Geodermatophilus ruber TaxID=504800 RepID=A0A1I4H9C3_9ACTN|nr:hypothetical protein [Geodermatophilus ruber]SFL38888.1 hypothetical protein SAMN04488085_11098 [Geodermatophilus ruber]